MSHRIIPRAEWGARHGFGRHTRPLGALGVVLHHTAGADAGPGATFDQDAAVVRGVEEHLQGRFRMGMGYTFLIAQSGRIFEGHPVDRIGAHTAGHNTANAGIAFIGNRDTSVVSRPALEAAAWLLRHGAEQGWWRTDRRVTGHSGHSATACPGRHGRVAMPTIVTLAQDAPTDPPLTIHPTPPPAPVRSVAQMAAEVIAGKHGTGHEARRRSLGVSASVYGQVRAEVNRRAAGGRPATPAPAPARSVAQMAAEVIAGKHGTGHYQRRRSLGVDAATYARVRAEVNRRL